jgi:hypothetical protein
MTGNRGPVFAAARRRLQPVGVASARGAELARDLYFV